jgi:hypothetical protein
MRSLFKIALATSIIAVPIVDSVKAQTYAAPPPTGPMLEGRSVYRGGTPSDFARNPLQSRSGKIEGASPYNPEGSSNVIGE